MENKKVIAFYCGLGSRYSYLASTQLADIENTYECIFDWQPLYSVELIKRAYEGHSPFETDTGRGQYDKTYRLQDIQRWAQFYNIAYSEPQPLNVDPHVLAYACWAMPEAEERKQMAQKLFRAQFVESRTINRNVIEAFVKDLGVEEQVFHEQIENGIALERHNEALERALASDAFGVPSFYLDDVLVWGNDRLPILKMLLQQ